MFNANDFIAGLEMCFVCTYQMKVLDVGDELADEPLQVLGSSLGGPQHLLVVGLLSAVVVCHDLVGDKGQTQDTQAAVTSHHHLWNCAHA